MLEDELDNTIGVKIVRTIQFTYTAERLRGLKVTSATNVEIKKKTAIVVRNKRMVSCGNATAFLAS